MMNPKAIRDIALIASTMLLLMLLNCEAASKTKTYHVGDGFGWDLTISIQGWANGKKFHAGDKLVFEYDTDRFDVVLVNKKGHDTCTVNEGATVLDSGYDTVTLAFGANYFIDSEPEVCAAGLKLAINATAPPP